MDANNITNVARPGEEEQPLPRKATMFLEEIFFWWPFNFWRVRRNIDKKAQRLADAAFMPKPAQMKVIKQAFMPKPAQMKVL